jgi:hypothetical protein
MDRPKLLSTGASCAAQDGKLSGGTRLGSGRSVDPEFGLISTACQVFGYSRSSHYRDAAKGHIRLLKRGRTTLVDFASVRAYLATPRSFHPLKSRRPKLGIEPAAMWVCHRNPLHAFGPDVKLRPAWKLNHAAYRS